MSYELTTNISFPERFYLKIPLFFALFYVINVNYVHIRDHSHVTSTKNTEI